MSNLAAPKACSKPHDYRDLFTVMAVQTSSMITSRKTTTPIAIAVTIHHLQPTFGMHILPFVNMVSPLLY